MIKARPFVYFSDAVLTPNNSVKIIRDAASKWTARPVVDIDSLFTQTFLSVRSQAMLYKSDKRFHGERFSAWVANCVDNLADGFVFESQAHKRPFTEQLRSQLFKPEAYFVPSETRKFVADLETYGIGWGILANETHLYLKVLQKLNIMPKGPLLQALGPTLFKPLPAMLVRAIEKAPKSCTELWFIGDCSNPCDNITVNPRIKCALINTSLTQSDPESMRFRIPSLDSLRPFLIPKQEIDLSFLTETSDLPQSATNSHLSGSHDPTVKLSTYIPLPVPQMSEPENSVAAWENKPELRT